MSKTSEELSSELSSKVQEELCSSSEKARSDLISDLTGLINQELDQAARHRPSIVVNPRRRLSGLADPFPVQTEIGSEARDVVAGWLYDVCLEQNWPLQTFYAVSFFSDEVNFPEI